MNDRQRAVEAHVFGTVQGVSYRVWVRGEATELGLAGWVRNERDGSVTARLAGTDTAVSTMIERLWIGPAGASVSGIDVEDLKGWTASEGFRIIA